MNVTDGQLAKAGDALAVALERKGMTIATAESCTGGWVAKVLTDRAGSSAYMMAGLVTYSNSGKPWELVAMFQQILELRYHKSEYQ